jgi:hypothetical protein
MWKYYRFASTVAGEIQVWLHVPVLSKRHTVAFDERN